MTTDIIVPDVDHARPVPSQQQRAEAAPLSDKAFYGLFLARLERRSHQTRRAYDNGVRQFGAFANPQSPLEGEGVVAAFKQMSGPQAIAIVEGYKASMTGLSRSTVNLRLTSLRVLTTLARKLGLIAWKLEVEGEECKTYRSTRGPGEEVVMRLLCILEHQIVTTERQNTGSVAVKAIRDKAIVHLLYYLGLRRGMAMAISLADLELDRGFIRVQDKGKGTQLFERTVPKKVVNALWAWLRVRPAECIPDPLGDPLFCGLGEHQRVRMAGESVRRMLRGYGTTLGATIRPHGLRHTAITDVLRKTNGNIRFAQSFSGHASAETVLKYDDNLKDDQGAAAALLAGE